MTAVESSNTITATESSAIDPRDVVSTLRASVLQLVPADIGLDVDSMSSQAPSNLVWGIVIETAHPDAVTSLISLADGSVSLYASDGVGCIGCGLHRDVRFASADLLEIAERSLALTPPAIDLQYPPEGHIRFYLLTANGLRCLQVSLEELDADGSQLNSLYFAGQRVINAIERVGAGQSLNQEIRVAQLTEGAGGYSQSERGSSCLSVGNAVRRLLR